MFLNKEKAMPAIHLTGRLALICRKTDILLKFVLEVQEGLHINFMRSTRKSLIKQQGLDFDDENGVMSFRIITVFGIRGRL